MLKASLVYYEVQDLNRALQFYTGVLGLPQTVRHGDEWAEVDAGAFAIGLHSTEGEPVEGDGGGTVSFTTDDIEALVKDLKSKGANVGPIRTPPRGRFAIVSDPDGNKLHIVEFKKAWVEETGYRKER